MTLQEAVAFARAHQPQIRAALARVDARRSEADIPRAQWLPVAGVTAQLFAATANNTTGTYVTPGFMDVPRIGGTRVSSTGPMQPYASTFVGLGGQQELFDFGRIAAQSAAADALVDVDVQRSKDETLDVIFDVEEAYFAVFAARAVLKASEDAFERARVHRDLARAGVGAGLRPPIELTRAEADLTRFDIGRIRSRGGLSVAEGVLAAAVGVPDESLDVVGTPPPFSEMPALTQAMQRAAARDPRILQALAELEAEEQRTRSIRAELRPDISLTGTLSGRAGGAPPSSNGSPADGNGWLPNVPNWNVGAVFNWPLFDGTVNARVDASRALQRVRHEDVAVAKHRQVVAIRLAYGGVSVARATLPGLERAVGAARANYAQADARFNAGMGTTVELADAEAIRTEAEIQLALGEFELARTRAVFGRAIAEGL
jgi:outer membrane protein